MITLQNLEKTFFSYPHLSPDLALWLTLSGSNYPCLEQIPIKKTRLFKYIENFTTKQGNYQIKRSDIFFIFLLEI